MGQKFSDAARSELLSAITDAATTINLLSGGDKFPAANAGTSAVSDANDWFKLVLQDASGFEIVYVRSHVSGSDQFTNVLRAQEGTTAKAFAAGTVVGLRQTAADAADVLTRIAGREPAIAPGSADDYLAGNKTWGSFPAKARATTLTGFSTASGADVVATDSILTAIGKLAKKILDHFGVGGGTHPLATTTVHGFLSAAEKVKLTGIAESAAALGTATPSALGTANAGVSAAGAHEDHVHPMPTAAQVGAEPSIAAGTTAQYWRGDKTWSDFATDVRATVLTGLSTATNAAVTAADSVLSAIGKLQKQFSDHFANTSNPHSVTAAQVGAATTVHGHAVGDVTGLSDQLTNLGTKLPLLSTSTRTLVISDAGQIIYASSNITIPANSSVAFPIGTVVTLVNSSSTASSISITTDTLRQAGTTNTGTRTLAGYGVATLLKVSSTLWMISGAGLT